jgi:hypothetical protein
MSAQLRLIDTTPRGASAPSAGAELAAMLGSDCEVTRIFGHHLAMQGASPRRCKLAPMRRRLIASWLLVYGEEVLQLAVEGFATSAWHQGGNDDGHRFAAIEYALKNEATIERWADVGERLRERLAGDDRRRAQGDAVHDEAEPVRDPAAVAAQLARLREMAAAMRARG